MLKIFRRFCHSFIDVSKTVAEGLANNEPVLTLETTILTHGMPYPQNLNTALVVEEVVKKQGVIPATIGVIKGRIKVGLDQESLKFLASPESKCVKISRRDFPLVLSQKLNGGTTVSGTLLIAKKIGIDVFVTGGIGGVHRDVQESFDISADLIELSRSPVMVISSGVKSILDIGRTLEYLETHGVCVVTYGETNDFPAFFTRKSGFQTIYNVTNTEMAADLLINIKKLGLESGILLGVPIPEQYSLDEVEIGAAIEKALNFCKERGVTGKSVTPFILNEVKKITDGKSLESNVALIKNNALIGSKIAVEYNKKKFNTFFSNVTQKRKFSTKIGPSKKVLVVGGAMMDIVVQPKKMLKKEFVL